MKPAVTAIFNAEDAERLERAAERGMQPHFFLFPSVQTAEKDQV
jgi:hypothetical protein